MMLKTISLAEAEMVPTIVVSKGQIPFKSMGTISEVCSPVAFSMVKTTLHLSSKFPWVPRTLSKMCVYMCVEVCTYPMATKMGRNTHYSGKTHGRHNATFPYPPPLAPSTNENTCIGHAKGGPTISRKTLKTIPTVPDFPHFSPVPSIFPRSLSPLPHVPSPKMPFLDILRTGSHHSPP